MTEAQIADAAEAAEQTPLEFMLSVMSDRSPEVRPPTTLSLTRCDDAVKRRGATP